VVVLLLVLVVLRGRLGGSHLFLWALSPAGDDTPEAKRVADRGGWGCCCDRCPSPRSVCTLGCHVSC